MRYCFLCLNLIFSLICRLSKPVTSLPLVSEVFPTLRTVLEALNVKFTEADCKDMRPI